MTRTNKNRAVREARKTWSVVVVYEDDPARGRAVVFCDQLVGKFWARFEFDVSWWSFARLADAASATEAADRAIAADLIAFATNREGDFPPPVKTWVETWLTRRGDREGLLIDLLDPVVAAGGGEGWKQQYLRDAAHHGALDYLTQIPQDISLTIPDSLDSFSQRADTVTSLLDDILHQQTPPPNLTSKG
jgi:hypothetical protein